jgi:hypothetical protein
MCAIVFPGLSKQDGAFGTSYLHMIDKNKGFANSKWEFY